jgi:hypothetical protein
MDSEYKCENCKHFNGVIDAICPKKMTMVNKDGYCKESYTPKD